MPKKLTDLPIDITLRSLGDYLTEKEKLTLAAVSHTTQGLFQPGRLEKMVNKLLLQVMHGEQEKAEKILKIHPELLTMTGTATDYSGRTFTTTAFQYALWAMDTHMCRMILDAITPGSTGDTLRADLIRQYEELETNGVTYEQEGQTHTNQHHFSFSPLITALQYYVDHVNDWYQNNNWAEIERQWCTKVGLAQRDVPAHVAQEYCHPTRSFYPTPNFNDGLERSLTFYNYKNNTDMQWWPCRGSSSSVLGVDFGISREWMGVRCVGGPGASRLGFSSRDGLM